MEIDTITDIIKRVIITTITMVIVIRKENERGQKMKNKFISAFAAIACPCSPSNDTK